MTLMSFNFFNRTDDKIIPENFNVVVWNMYKGAMKNWEQDFLFLTRKYDLMITQEMAMRGIMKDHFETLESFEFSSATSFYNNGYGRTGVATISKYQSKGQFFQRSRYREPIIKTPKVVLFNEYDVFSGEELLIANIHAVNFVTSIELSDQLRNVSKVIKEHKGPVIFAGNFNTWTKRKQRKMRSILKAAGLSEAKYPNGDYRLRYMKKTLDYLWYKKLKLKSSIVLKDIKGSDHIPMGHEFELIYSSN